MRVCLLTHALTPYELTGVENHTAQLAAALARALCGRERLRDTPSVSNIRHIQLLEDAHAALARATDAAAAVASEELVLADLDEARRALEEVSGKRTPDAVLQRIFEQFCIGK